MKNGFFLFWTVFLAFSLCAESPSGKIKIVDDRGQAIPGATVEWVSDGERKVLAADVKGELAVPVTERLNRKMTFYAPGFCPLIVAGDRLNSLKEIVLVPDRLLLHHVQLTATRTPHTVQSTPVPGQVISREEFVARGVLSSVDILEQLEGITLTREEGSWGNQGNISLCGLPSEHTLVLVDGQKQVGGHNGTDVSSIPVELIEQVEVVKGAGSALYGSDAIGGVVQFVTRPVLNRPSFFSGKLSYGGKEQYSADVSGGLSRENWGFYIGGGQLGGDGVDPETDTYRNQSVFGKGCVKFSDSLSMTLSTRYETMRLEDQSRDQRRRALNQRTEWNRSGHTLALRLAFFDYDHQTDDLASDWVNQQFDMELASTHVLPGHHVLSAGMSSIWENVDDRGKGYDANQSTQSLFVQDEWTARPFTLVLGLRTDHHEKWGMEFNPRVGIKWDFSESVKVRFSVGRAFKAPQLVELYGSWIMGPYLVTPNPELEPEKSWGYQAGLDWQLGSNLYFSVTGFINKLEDQVVSVYDRKKRPFRLSWINLGRSRTQGIDWEGKFSPDRSFKLSAGFSLHKTEDMDSGLSLLYQPSWSGRLKADVNTKFVEFHALVRATGKRWFESTEGREHLDAFVTADLTLCRSMGRKVQVYVKFVNLFGKKEVPDEYNLDGVRAFAGISFRLQ